MKNYFLLIPFIAIFFSCGGNKDKTTINTDDGKISIGDVKNAAEQIQQATETADKKKEERRAKGDTLAMNYKDLQAYLPEISGYAKDGNPGGESVNMPGLGSWSKAEQNYKKSDTERIEVELMDYNQSHMGFSSATLMFGMSISVENDREKSGTFDTGIPGVRGYEQMYKDRKEANITYAIADRFLLTIRGDGTNDTEALKAVAKSMKLGELAAK